MTPATLSALTWMNSLAAQAAPVYQVRDSSCPVTPLTISDVFVGRFKVQVDEAYEPCVADISHGSRGGSLAHNPFCSSDCICRRPGPGLVLTAYGLGLGLYALGFSHQALAFRLEGTR